MAVKTDTSSVQTDAGLSAQDLVAAAQGMARSYARARESLPQLPATYQSARPWFIVFGRMVAHTHAGISAETRAR